MRHRRDDAVHAEGSELFEGDAVFAAEGPRLQSFDARRLFAGDDELLDLVVEPTDLRLLELLAAQLLGPVDHNTANAFDSLAPRLDAHRLVLLLRGGRGDDGPVDVVKHAPAPAGCLP